MISHIKSFKTLRFDLQKTSVLVGQNDHGKLSILKVIDIVVNQLGEDTVAIGALHPDLAERLLPIFPVNAKARRVTLYYDEGGAEKALHITVRADLTFTVLLKIERNAKTTLKGVETLRALREHNKFVLIPALRDASSTTFQELFSRMLREHGLSKMIPQKAGGTPKEYRVLKDIRDKVTTTIRPYINEALLPEIEKHLRFKTQHKLGLKFDVDVQDVGEWIMDNLRLGFQMTEKATLPLRSLKRAQAFRVAYYSPCIGWSRKLPTIQRSNTSWPSRNRSHFSIRSDKKSSTKIFYQRRQRICVSS